MTPWVVGLLGVLAVAVAGITVGVSRRTGELTRFRTEAAALGFSPSNAPGSAGRVHVVGEWRGRPAVLGYYPGDGGVESSGGETGIWVVVSLRVAEAPAGVEVWPVERIGRGSTLDLVIRAAWPSGWSGELGRQQLPLDAGRDELRAALDRVVPGP
ncbi:MAG: hypothetical protein ABMA64_30860 [Myxococcota bacterium]